MSPRAAWRLETLGFERVYDYAAGKVDWAACGLPIEGKTDERASLTDFLIVDVPTCGLTEQAGQVSQRLEDVGYRYCPVVNDRKVVLGLFRTESSKARSTSRVESVMEAGPTTLRANVSLDQAAAYLSKNNLTEVMITATNDKLLGVLTRQIAERAVDELGPQK